MWHLQGMLLYRSIEHRNEESTRRDRVEADFLNPYADLFRDPRVNPEAAKKIAA